jgi:hypothetical protein
MAGCPKELSKYSLQNQARIRNKLGKVDAVRIPEMGGTVKRFAR